MSTETRRTDGVPANALTLRTSEAPPRSRADSPEGRASGPAGGTVSLPVSPDVQLLGGSVAALQGPAALDAYRLMVEGIGIVRRRDGIEPSPRLLRTVAVLKAAAHAARSHAPDMSDTADVRNGSPSASSVMSGEVLGIEEVARMCRVGHRQARRLAPSLGGRKTGRGWKFDRGLVQAYIDAEGRR